MIPIPPSFRDRTAAPDGGQSGALPDAQPLTVSELSVLEALDRLADGAHPEPEIVKPAQAMAALIRLLLRKRIVTDRELLDELSKK